ncbi:hypothetical protein H6P81_019006 [Aristolochia fimbriata]|uniref:Uncharacterized protein n=1 Tax=Aristolochia fimbriata TaxID=158543 RepID=A0AAV7E2V7_ARIFI|nr:hypothetical protein H6P81_019006 [Aristolochia fimbriata]
MHGKRGESLAVPSSNSTHIRSTTLPTREHPLNDLQLDEKLNKLRNWDVLASTSFLPVDTLLNSLCGLGDLYQTVEDLLQVQQSKQGLVHDKVWVEKELDGSLRLLDAIGMARDDLFQMKEHINNIQSALRCSKMQQELENRIYAYLSFKKKMKKEILKGFKELKRAQHKSKCSPVSETQEDSMLIIWLTEARFIIVSVFESLLNFRFKPRPNTAQSSLVSKWMKRGQVACEGQAEVVSEFGRLEASLHSLCSQKPLTKQKPQHVRKQLDDLEKRVKELDENLSSIFRSLIKIRVTLLNILTN